MEMRRPKTQAFVVPLDTFRAFASHCLSGQEIDADNVAILTDQELMTDGQINDNGLGFVNGISQATAYFRCSVARPERGALLHIWASPHKVVIARILGQDSTVWTIDPCELVLFFARNAGFYPRPALLEKPLRRFPRLAMDFLRSGEFDDFAAVARVFGSPFVEPHDEGDTTDEEWRVFLLEKYDVDTDNRPALKMDTRTEVGFVSLPDALYLVDGLGQDASESDSVDLRATSAIDQWTTLTQLSEV